jgi:hypothetical protein
VLIPLMGLEMGHEKRQRINPCAALFAEGGTLLGLAHGNFPKHGYE